MATFANIFSANSGIHHPMKLPSILTLILSVILTTECLADVRLPDLLSDNMVLQRNSMVNLWGKADPNEKIVIETGWNAAHYSISADGIGNWQARVPTGEAGGPFTITFTGKNVITLKYILLGEVWLCSGQSNMEYSIEYLGGWKNFEETRLSLENHDFSAIRLCTVQKQTSRIPSDSCKASWVPLSSVTGFNFSAVALFFGIHLYDSLKIPLGLINASWGGTPAEAWTSNEFLQQDKDLQYYLKNPNGISWEPGQSSLLFNGMIAPLARYKIKGVIWYQGEANRWDADLYGKLFCTMIKCWRTSWNTDLPFYFVQIAPFRYGQNGAEELTGYLREAQALALTLPNTGMITTLDIGNLNNIHPANKQEVGKRLAYLALSKTYGLKVPAYEGPVFKSMALLNNCLILRFRNIAKGLRIKGIQGRLSGFRIAGPDHVFREAVAEISDSAVIACSDTVMNPVAVRYAFRDTDTASLMNSEGIPAYSFRTDTLPFYYRNVNIDLDYQVESGNTVASLTCPDSLAEIRYTLDGSLPDRNSPEYQGKILLEKRLTIKAAAFKSGAGSPVHQEAGFIPHLAFHSKLKTRYSYTEQYSGGKDALVNGILGTKNFRDGNWQGYYGKDLVTRITLPTKIFVHTISIGFLESQQAWIFLPQRLEIQVSRNGVFWSKVYDVNIEANQQNPVTNIKVYTASVNRAGIRYIRLVAGNLKKCPDWHAGKGNKAWLFADEIIVE
ncbi:MAG: chitobiase/beta-hexosaminidase C-terminal domain-containing protein [Bacteroidetes bacterium]|nr:chitobiase/beta-hexosaminidase C-terminal domain-containing protein [Bacteroidota bacterium]